MTLAERAAEVAFIGRSWLFVATYGHTVLRGGRALFVRIADIEVWFDERVLMRFGAELDDLDRYAGFVRTPPPDASRAIARFHAGLVELRDPAFTIEAEFSLGDLILARGLFSSRTAEPVRIDWLMDGAVAAKILEVYEELKEETR